MMVSDSNGAGMPPAANDNAAQEELRREVKRLMEVLTRLLVGPGRDPRATAFGDTMMVVVGAPLASPGLLWLADLARLNRKHVVHLSWKRGSPLPGIAFAYRQGERVNVYEQCFLSLHAGEHCVTLIPDSFANGAYQLTPAMRLKRRRAPANLEAGLSSIQRAYERFDHLLAITSPTDDWEPIRATTR